MLVCDRVYKEESMGMVLCKKDKILRVMSFSVAAFAAVKPKGKSYNGASAMLAACIKEIPSQDRRDAILSNAPFRIFEDVDAVMDPVMAFELLARGICHNDAYKTEILETLSDLQKVDSASPLRPFVPPKREKAREEVREAVQAAKNDGRVEQELFHTPESEVRPVKLVRRAPTVRFTQASEEEDEEKRVEDQHEEKEDKDEIELTFKNPALLYEPQLWGKVEAEALEDLERGLRSEFLNVTKAHKWEYTMAEHAIDVTVSCFQSGIDPLVLQVLVDQFLLRLKFCQDGVPGAKINMAMKKLAMNKLPKRYRNILTATNVGKDQFGGSQGARDHQSHTGHQNHSFRGNNRDRVPQVLWEQLTPEQKALLKAKQR